MTVTEWRDTALEPEVLDAISLDEPWALVEKFSTLVRMSGSREERKAVDYITERLRRWNVPYTLHEPECFISLPVRSELEVVGRDGRAIAAKSPSFSVSTGGERRTGTIEYLPSGHAASVGDLFGSNLAENRRDLTGKVVLTEGYPMPAKLNDLSDMGAVAAIFISPGERIHEGICTTIWGAPDLDSFGRQPRLPVLAISQSDGAWLVERAQAGPVEVSFSTLLDEGWRRIPVLVAELEGRSRPEEFVLVHGHIDSWHVGVGDNATGDATLLELARVFGQFRDRLDRTLRIAWWSGHSHGRYAGSTWYADEFGLDIDEHCVAHINCDSPGCRWATEYRDVMWMEEARPVAQAAIRDVTGQPSEGARVLRAGDVSFNNIGVTTFFMLTSTMPEALRQEKGYYHVGGCGGNIAWHTEDDTLEIADRDNLLRDIKVYAAATLRVLNAPVLPFDFRGVADEFAASLRDYQSAAGAAFDLGPAIEETGRLKAALERFQRHAESLAGRSPDDPAVRRANETMLRLARVLVSVNHSRLGKFRQDPAVSVPPLPDLAPARNLARTQDPHLRRVTETHLRRGRNRVIAAIREAARLADAATAGGS